MKGEGCRVEGVGCRVEGVRLRVETLNAALPSKRQPSSEAEIPVKSPKMCTSTPPDTGPETGSTEETVTSEK